MSHTITILDIGSNSLHSTIFELSNSGGLRVLDSSKAQIELSAAIDKNGMIPFDKIDAIITFVRTVQDMSDRFESPIRAIATYAVRASKNFEALINEILNQTGIEIEVIDGLEEARLIYLGLRKLVSNHDDTFVGIDIGGGSTEIIYGTPNDLLLASSVNLGFISATEKFRLHSSQQSISNLEAYIYTRIRPISVECSNLTPSIAFGTSGTAKTLASIDMKLQGLADSKEIEGHILTFDRIDEITNILKQKTPDQISTDYDVDRRRSHYLLGGTLILRMLSKTLNINSWYISTSGLRDGAAWDYIQNCFPNEQRPRKQVLLSTIEEFGQRFGINEHVSKNIAHIAVSVFDELEKNNLIKSKEHFHTSLRDLVYAASYLQNIGQVINYSRYHKHTYYIIANSSLMGFTQKERHIIGLSARYSRKGSPKKQKKLSKKPYLLANLKLIGRLSACVRLGRILGSNPRTSLESVALISGPGERTLYLSLSPGYQKDVEEAKLSQETNYLRESLGIQINFVIGSPDTSSDSSSQDVT